jgi:hypothetical protein
MTDSIACRAFSRFRSYEIERNLSHCDNFVIFVVIALVNKQ